MKRNFLDKVVSYVSPSAGLKRSRSRWAEQHIAEFLNRHYEGGAGGRRFDGWWSASQSSSANTEIGSSIQRLRDRSRDLTRNNPYAGRAIQTICVNTVGTGIVGQIKHENDLRAQRLQAAWKKWAESTDCDFEGRHDLYGLQAIALRAISEGGDVLVIRRRLTAADGMQIPLQLQVVEGDYLDHYREGESPLSNGGYIMQGIEFNSSGKRSGYYLWSQHPGERILTSRQLLTSRRVPESEVIHTFRTDRAGQIRGVPWGASVILRARDFDEYEDAQLLRQKIAACFAGFIEDIEAPDSIPTKENVLSERLEPGIMEMLPPGKRITFPNTPQVSDDGYSVRMLRAIAVGYGVTYESLTGDLSNVNFSSGRMGWIEFQNNIEQWRWKMLIPQFCDPIFRWWLEAAALAGLTTDGASIEWTPPKRQMIDPSKEVAGKIAEIRGGLTTLSDAMLEQGRNPDDLFAQLKKDADTLDKLGLKLDCDPRYIAASGNAQPIVPGGVNEEAGT